MRSPAGEQQVLHDQGERRPAGRAPDAATARAAARRTSSTQGTNGSQIRSTSARLICERSASSTIATPAPDSHSTTRVPGSASRPRPRANSSATAREREGTGAERERGQVAPHPVGPRPAAADPLVVAGVDRGQRLEVAEPERVERGDHRQRGRDGGRQREPRPGHDQHGDRQHPQQRQAVGQHHARSPAAAPASSDHGTLRRVAASARQAMPQAAKAANIASAETACQIAAGPRVRNGAARRASVSAPSVRSGDQHADGGGRREHGDDEPRREPAAERRPASSSQKKNSAPAGWPATCTGQVVRDRGVGDAGWVLLNSVAASEVRRTTGGPEVLVRLAEDVARCRASRRRGPAPASTPGRPTKTTSSSRRQVSRSESAVAWRTARAASDDRRDRAPPDPGVPLRVQRRERVDADVPAGHRGHEHRQHHEGDGDGQAPRGRAAAAGRRRDMRRG